MNSELVYMILIIKLIKLLCDEEKILCDENVTKQSRASVDVTKCADINSVTENILFDDSEVI